MQAERLERVREAEGATLESRRRGDRDVDGAALEPRRGHRVTATSNTISGASAPDSPGDTIHRSRRGDPHRDDSRYGCGRDLSSQRRQGESPWRSSFDRRVSITRNHAL